MNEKKKNKTHFKGSFLVPSGLALVSFHVFPHLIPLLCAQGMSVNVFHSKPNIPDFVSGKNACHVPRAQRTVHPHPWSSPPQRVNTSRGTQHGGEPSTPLTPRGVWGRKALPSAQCHQERKPSWAILFSGPTPTPPKASLNPKQS